MKRMTGYAFDETQVEEASLSVEMKGCNSRFLEVLVYLPPMVSSLEPGIREYISGRFKRGKIEIGIRIKDRDSAISVPLYRRPCLFCCSSFLLPLLHIPKLFPYILQNFLHAKHRTAYR